MSEKHDPKRAAEEAKKNADNDPKSAQTGEKSHDPYAHLRPYRWKKGQSGNPKGKPPGVRSLAKRFRQAGTLRPSDVKVFEEMARKLGMGDSIKGMDLMDLLAISTIAHAIGGKGSALNQTIEVLQGTVTPVRQWKKGKKRTKEQDKKDAIEFYEAVLASDSVTVKEKLQARQRLDIILGLVVEDGGVTTEQRARELREALEAMDKVIGDDDDEESDE